MRKNLDLPEEHILDAGVMWETCMNHNYTRAHALRLIKDIFNWDPNYAIEVVKEAIKEFDLEGNIF